MNTTAKILTGWLTAALSLSASITFAAPVSGTTALALSAAGVAQTNSPTRIKDRRKQADDLLRRARQAMAEDDLQAAELLISQAKATGVRYSVLNLGDTPDKVRRDLDRKRKSANKSGSSGGLLSVLKPKKDQPSRTDPFLQNTTQAPAVAYPSTGTPGKNDPNARLSSQMVGPRQGKMPQVNPIRLPSTGRGNTGSPLRPFGDMPSASSLPPINVGQAGTTLGAIPSVPGNGSRQGLLLEARRTLAFGDTKRAASLLDQAKLRPGADDPLGDTPEKVEAAVREYQDMMARPKDTELFRRAFARMMMRQAEALLSAQDHELAERLASQAADQRLNYGPFESNPAELLKRIAADRRKAGNPAGATASLSIREQSPGVPIPSMAARKRADELTRRSREALRAGDLDFAEELAVRADRLGVPDSTYGAREDRPGLVLLDIRKARGQPRIPGRLDVREQPRPAARVDRQVTTATGTLPEDHTASLAVYDSSNDPTRNVRVTNEQPASLPGDPRSMTSPQAADRRIPSLDSARIAMQQATSPEPIARPGSIDAAELLRLGERALERQDRDGAYQYFQQAAGQIDQLDPSQGERLQRNLRMLSQGVGSRSAGSNLIDPPEVFPRDPGSTVGEAAQRQQVLVRQVAADLLQQSAKARSMLPTDPKGALALLEQTRKNVEAAGLEPDARARLLGRVDHALAETRQFIDQNSPRIELEEKNQRTQAKIDLGRRTKLEIQEKLALLFDDFNRKVEEGRFAEAEVLAKQAEDLDRDNPVVHQLVWHSKLLRRNMRNNQLRADYEDGFVRQLDRVREAAVPFDDGRPYRFPDVRDWEQLTGSRREMEARAGRQRTERDLEIEQKLRTPISVQFREEPLATALETLAEMADVNLHLDVQALQEYGVDTNLPVTLEVRKEIMLKSALNLILEPLQLSYMIKDEVLKITSEQEREGEVYAKRYDVADLVMPIPNFTPGDQGLDAALNKAMGNIGFGGAHPMGMYSSPLSVVASRNGQQSSGMINPAVLAQMSAPGGGGSRMTSGPVGFGPGGLGGAAQADFDSLIELITSTINPDSWDDVGGPGSIKEFATNLSLVVSQTQDVHEEIEDLLEQLRRMQDLQVTIEVKFITLNDNFFERIGVDFDFDIDDGIDRPFQVWGRQTGDIGDDAGTTGGEPPRNVQDVDGDRSVLVGMQQPGVFSADLDIPFTQGSFGLAVPQFGGFDASAGASLGFAILSDIEAFFFINAAQGDRRSNVLQAPKVTLFNGQQAYVSDTSQSPFVISVIPVVGDFAAAQQPVIVVLSEGTFLTVHAVVSKDRRFVRLTVVPFFSRIGDVNTFQFEGTQTTTTDTSAEGNQNDPNDSTKNSNGATTSRSGTTVQLPTFSFITVTTTVSVPDGGTVLMGGIKRLREGRNEFGVPILNKVPYLNRLFKNVGIGRETQSLMMMVTPRIIIQEEEEDRLGIQPPT